VCLGDFDGSGIDDACDPIRNLAVAWEAGTPAPSSTTVEWLPHASGGHSDVRYDLVRGDLAALVAGGDFTGSVETCVADDHTNVNVLFIDDDPAPGEGQWFLVRGVWVTPDLLIHPMTYDTWVVDVPSGAGQHETRDPGIGASPLTCP
jgi:hypothetical protein